LNEIEILHFNFNPKSLDDATLNIIFVLLNNILNSVKYFKILSTKLEKSPELINCLINPEIS